MRLNLSCEHFRSALPWYVNGSLPSEEHTAVERHVITCAQCRKDLAEWREMATATQYIRQVRQPPALSQVLLWNELQAHITEEGAPVEQPTPTLKHAGDFGGLPSTTASPHRQIARRNVPAVASVILTLTLVVAFVAIFRTLGHHLATTSSTIGVAATPSTIILSVYAGEDSQGNPLGYLLALRQSDGAQLWRSAFLTHPSLPVAGDGVVIVTSTGTAQSTDSQTLDMLAFDTKTGRTRWQYQTTSVASQPLLVNGIVYLSSAIDTPGTLSALTATTGAIKWQIPLAGLASTLTQTNGILYATVVDPCVYSCTTVSGVVAIRANDGRTLWELPPAKLAAPLLVAGSRLIVFDSAGMLTGFDATTGRPIWHTVIPGASVCNATCDLVSAGGVVIVSTTGQTPLSAIPSSLFAVYANTGDRLWQRTDQGMISMVLTDGEALIYSSLASNTGVTHLIASGDGTQRWQSPTDVQSQPLAAAHGTVYAAEAPRGGQDSWTVVARVEANGQSQWYTALADQPTQTIVNGGMLMISAHPLVNGTTSQVIVGMSATDGTVRWHMVVPAGFTAVIMAK